MPTSVRNALSFTDPLATNAGTGPEVADYALRDGLKYLTALETRTSDGAPVAGNMVSVRYGLTFTEPLASVLGVQGLISSAQLDTVAVDQTPSAIGADLISSASLSEIALSQTQTLATQTLTAGSVLSSASLIDLNVLGLGDNTTLTLGDGSNLSLE